MVSNSLTRTVEADKQAIYRNLSAKRLNNYFYGQKIPSFPKTDSLSFNAS